MLETVNKTKILVRVWPTVMKVINRDLRHLHVRRDSYLNSLLKAEIENLAKEVEFTTPDGARAQIKRRLRDLSPEPETFVLDRDVKARIDDVLTSRNIARNSFINRVLFFLVAKPPHLDALDIRYVREPYPLEKPLDEAWSALQDPFFNIRSANEEKFYRLHFADYPLAKNWPSLFGLNCAISPEDWEFFNTPIENLQLI